MEHMTFRAKILKASRELTRANVEEIKYLLKDVLGDGVLENINTQLDLFLSLETLGWINPTSSDFLYGILTDINREDIVRTLKGESAESSAPNDYRRPTNFRPNETIDRRILDNVANHIAADWKRLGRMLDLPESKIDQIDIDYRKTYEKALQTLRTWSQSCTSSWDLLKRTLEEIPRHDIVRLVESNLPAVNQAPAPAPVRAPNPPAQGPPAYAQATSVSEDNTQYSAHSNLTTQFTDMRMDEDQHGVKACRELDSNTSSDSEIEVVSPPRLRQDGPDLCSPPTSMIIAENPVGPANVEIVLGNELTNRK